MDVKRNHIVLVTAALSTVRNPSDNKNHFSPGMENDMRVEHGYREDQVTGTLEAQTAKIPSSGYLAFALGSMAASAILKAVGKNDWSLFVGQWAPAFLIIGVYNKLVKQHGSDAFSKAA